MVYQDKFVAVLKYGGKILREQDGGTFLLPFGSEYSVLLKNLSGQRVLIAIEIDGKDVMDGRKILLNPKQDCDLEGFMDSSGKVSHRFKFIEKTEEISDFRGDKIDDGIIRIGYTFEKVFTEVNYVNTYHNNYFNPNTPWRDSPPRRPFWQRPYSSNVHNKRDIPRSMNATESRTDNGDIRKGILRGMNNPSPQATNDLGITVKGSSSDQAFKDGSIGELEKQEHTAVLRLKGRDLNNGESISKPLLVNTKLDCDTCGKKSTSESKFCNNCGTSLLV